MNGLYPLKFKPQFLEKIWGGQKIKTILGKDFGALPNCGESWEISGVEGNISVVSNGFLAGNNLQELVEIYMGDLVGEKNYEKFGVEFPLLIKFIDASDDLSIQVHPNDELSKKRHNAYGKTEMWYIIDAEKKAKLNLGFNREINKEQYLQFLNEGKLMDILSIEEVKKGNVFFIPPGCVHAIGSGILLAEIQQTSDISYRIFDYNRKDKNGNDRELHNDLALNAIDFTFQENYRTDYKPEKNKPIEIASCKYFSTNLIELAKSFDKDFYELDTFIIYICLEGGMRLDYQGGFETLQKGETLLVPASISSFVLKPSTPVVKVLEVYIGE